jgi:serralysin
MPDMTPQEQLMLELINRARLDPTGEAKRFGISLNEGVADGDKISKAPKQVLAGNDDLLEAANSHSDWMLDKDKFQHEETGGGGTGKDPGDRMEAAGYDFTGNWTLGENISWRGSTGAINETQMIIQQHKDLFVDAGVSGRGHRLNILSNNFEEIGIGQQTGKFTSGGQTFNASMVTQDFARSGSNVFVTGVVYDDTDGDDFFSVGEQVTGRTVSAGGGVNDQTGGGGGYELKFDASGAKSIDFNLAGGTVTIDLTLGGTNVKVDVVNGTEVWTNATVTDVSSNVTEIHLLGLGKASLNGADSGQAMFANAGLNTFQGNGGADDFVFLKGTTGKTEKKADTIADFSQADGDQINLDAWDANTKQNGNQDFTFIDGQKFHGTAGELRFFREGGDTWIEGDTNGDRKADLLIKLDGAITLVGADFDL